MIEILNYIDRLKKSGLSKHKSLEFLEIFLELRQAESPYMWFCDNDGDCDNCKDRCSIWQKGHNTPKNKCEIVKCKDCIHGYYDPQAGDYDCNEIGDRWHSHDGDWFCADGREKTDGD